MLTVILVACVFYWAGSVLQSAMEAGHDWIVFIHLAMSLLAVGAVGAAISRLFS